MGYHPAFMVPVRERGRAGARPC